MNNYLFLVECVEGSLGWGNTGDKAYMTHPAVDDNGKLIQLSIAKTYIKRQIPGGWKFTYKGRTSQNFYKTAAYI